MGLHSQHVSAIRAVGGSRQRFHVAKRVFFISIVISSKYAEMTRTSQDGRSPKQRHDRGTDFVCTRRGARFEDWERLSHGGKAEGEKTYMRATKLMCPEHRPIVANENYSRVLKRIVEDELCCGILEGVTKLSRP